MNIKEATNNALYVEWLNDYTFAVWKGGHTINFYFFNPTNNRNINNVDPVDCINVGSFEENDATLQEVKDGIESIRDMGRL